MTFKEQRGTKITLHVRAQFYILMKDLSDETHVSSVVVRQIVITCRQITFQQFLKQNSF